MGASAAGGLIPELHEKPTSVFLHGSCRPLLDWIVYAMLTQSDPEYVWTYIRFDQERMDPLGPFGQDVVPASQLSFVLPTDLRHRASRTSGGSTPPPQRGGGEANTPAPGFFDLPVHTQELIARVRKAGRVPVLALSNGHRLASFYPTEDVPPTLRAIQEAGVSLVMTWVDTIPGGSSAFDFVIGVEGTDPSKWREATLRCSLGYSRGPMRTGHVYRLGSLPEVAGVLTRMRIPGS